MKKIIALIFVAAVVLLVMSRYRVYVRDPIGGLYRGGVKEDGAQVYINYASDVLIENDNPPSYIEVVQHGDHAGVPKQTWCVHYVGCLLDADEATLLPGSKVKTEVLNGKMVQFRDSRGEADAMLH